LDCYVEVVNPVRDSRQIYGRRQRSARRRCKIEIGLGLRRGIRV
jgi:hypothetical protein